MKKLFRLAAPVALALCLARCGDICSSKAADVKQVASCAELKADADVSIEVQLCAQCSDSTPSCAGEVVGDRLELDARFQECEANKGCPATACASNKVLCTVHTPAASGTYQIVTQNQGQPNEQAVQIAAAGPTSCAL